MIAVDTDSVVVPNPVVGWGSTNTTVFTVVDQVLFRPPPYLHGDRLVQVTGLNKPGGSGGNNLNAHRTQLLGETLDAVAAGRNVGAARIACDHFDARQVADRVGVIEDFRKSRYMRSVEANHAGAERRSICRASDKAEGQEKTREMRPKV